jgi:hypothetical protein
VISLLVYTIIAVVIGRDVLAHLGSTIANDPGDPLLTAAILKWNATHVPLTDGWYQFPIFYPTRDTLTFSEHLLGLYVIASPIYWLTGDVAATYNLVLLLTYPLCGIAMYALVFVDRQRGGAFIWAGVRVCAVSRLAAAFNCSPHSGRRWRLGHTHTSRPDSGDGWLRRGVDFRAHPAATPW